MPISNDGPTSHFPSPEDRLRWDKLRTLNQMFANLPMGTDSVPSSPRQARQITGATERLKTTEDAKVIVLADFTSRTPTRRRRTIT